MKRCHPVRMRNNLEVVDQFRASGIDFVPIPVTSDEVRAELIASMLEALDLIQLRAEAEAGEG